MPNFQSTITIFTNMSLTNYKVVGVMSGTSLDGVDLAYIDFNAEGGWSFQILEAETVPYSETWGKRLRNVIFLSKPEADKLDQEYTILLSTIISSFLKRHNIQELDAVCSHGHTIFHVPHQGFTLQVGNQPELAKHIGHRVVCDFRVQDVKLGGQGAPLVPIGDRLLFGDYAQCLNLGGFANISSETEQGRLAFDICPVNIVMNQLVASVGLSYDDRGKIASEGTIDETLLQQLNSLSYYKEQPPKSLGLEWVKQEVFPILENSAANLPQKLRTFVEHIAMQISAVTKPTGTLLATGGGAYNDFLMDRIRVLSSAKVIIPDAKIVEYKEALIFGLLGVLRLRNQVNCLQSVTGASKDHSSGNVFTP